VIYEVYHIVKYDVENITNIPIHEERGFTKPASSLQSVDCDKVVLINSDTSIYGASRGRAEMHGKSNCSVNRIR
jgi:hypothetical protein